VCALLAGIGQVPATEANAASLRQRPGWENAAMAWAAVTGRRITRADAADPGTRPQGARS
jgi:hypothetical protein